MAVPRQARRGGTSQGRRIRQIGRIGLRPETGNGEFQGVYAIAKNSDSALMAAQAQLVALKQEVAWLKSLRDEEDSDDDGDGHAKSEPKREPPPSPRVSPATEHRQPQSQFDFFLEHGYLVEINRPQRALYARRLP